MDKQNTVHALDGVLFSLRRQDTLDPCCNTREPQYDTQLNKLVTEGQTLKDPLIRVPWRSQGIHRDRGT